MLLGYFDPINVTFSITKMNDFRDDLTSASAITKNIVLHLFTIPVVNLGWQAVIDSSFEFEV